MQWGMVQCLQHFYFMLLLKQNKKKGLTFKPLKPDFFLKKKRKKKKDNFDYYEFSEKLGLDILFKYSLCKMIYVKCQIHFFTKKKKKFFTNIVISILRVKVMASGIFVFGQRKMESDLLLSGKQLLFSSMIESQHFILHHYMSHVK